MARFIVAITGGVASGKSVATGLFGKLGIAVVDADVCAREVVAPGQPALLKIVRRFGPDVLLKDGSLDRVKMRALVFNSAPARKDLESITHPRIRLLLRDRCEGVPGPYAIVAIPLLAETGARAAYAWLDRILVVDAPISMQRARLMSRDGVDEPLADQMIKAQARRGQRLAIATDVLQNDGTEQSFAESVQRVDAIYRSLATKS